MAHVLITGGTGFLGQAIVRALLARSHRVTVLTRTPNRAANLRAFRRNRLLILLAPTISLAALHRERPIDAIIHAATAYGRFGESKSEIYQTNVTFPMRLARFAATRRIAAFINTDTFFPRGTPLRNFGTKYADSKKDFLRAAKKILRGTPCKLINLRLFQMYGPADNPKKFTSWLIAELMKKTREPIPLTPGKQRRDYLFVNDAADAFAAVIKQRNLLPSYATFDIGTGKTHTLRTFARTLARALKSDRPIGWNMIPYQAQEIMESHANVRKNRLLNWRAKTSLASGVRATICWYQTQQRKNKVKK